MSQRDHERNEGLAKVLKVLVELCLAFDAVAPRPDLFEEAQLGEREEVFIETSVPAAAEPLGQLELCPLRLGHLVEEHLKEAALERRAEEPVGKACRWTRHGICPATYVGFNPTPRPELCPRLRICRSARRIKSYPHGTP